MSPDLTTLIAELEEAERAATPGPWMVDPDEREGMEWNNHIIGMDGNRICFMAHNPNDNSQLEASARLIALMRTHLPTLLKAVKRQGEALEKIANSPTRGVGCNPALLFETARAALKETTDV